MAASISASVGSYESGAKNQTADVRTVQELLTQAAKTLRSPAFDPKGIDGQIARVGSRSDTVKAIANFQKQQVGMSSPDRRIDVNGNTWKKLIAVAGPVAPKKPAKTIGLITLTVTHGGKIPTGTKFKARRRRPRAACMNRPSRSPGASRGRSRGPSTRTT